MVTTLLPKIDNGPLVTNGGNGGRGGGGLTCVIPGGRGVPVIALPLVFCLFCNRWFSVLTLFFLLVYLLVLVFLSKFLIALVLYYLVEL